MTTPHDDHVRPTRRDLLLWSGGALAAASLSGCSFLSTDPSGKDATGAKAAAKGKEAPALAALAKDGKLPKLAERLPKNPLVVKPVEKVGVYGGTFKTVLLNAADTSWLGRTVGYEALMRFDPTGTKVIPNIAEAVNPSNDGREFTVKLREGMKWSDGEPFTADDIVFAYNDVILNDEINPVVPEYITSDGKPAKITKVDDVTVTFTFPNTNGLFYTKLAYTGGALTSFPQHYMEKFHKKYNPEVENDAKKEKMASWTDLWGAKADGWANAELPTLRGWVVTNPLGKGNRVVVERNPYYWKTDPEGSQLPYIDNVALRRHLRRPGDPAQGHATASST